MRLWIVLLAACGAPRSSPPTIANAAPAIDAAPEAVEPRGECTEDTPVSIQIGRAPATAALEVCMTGEESQSLEAREQGFITYNKEANLVLRRVGKPDERTQIHTWTDGWEWGSSVTLAGVLDAKGSNSALLILGHSYGTGPGIEALGSLLETHAFVGGEWIVKGTQSANRLEVSVAADRSVATITGCVIASDASATGCGDYADASPIAEIELRWDGAEVQETYQTPPTP